MVADRLAGRTDVSDRRVRQTNGQTGKGLTAPLANVRRCSGIKSIYVTLTIKLKMEQNPRIDGQTDEQTERCV